MREAMERHLQTFNAHPYLAAAAVGALARLEADGADPSDVARFRSALSGPLGSLGDRVVWSSWRPFCVLAAAAAYLGGIPAGWCALGFVVLYSVGHVGLRAWGFQRGWEAGLRLGRELRDSPLDPAVRILKPVNAVLVGAVVAMLGLLAAPAGSTTTLVAAGLLGAGVLAGHAWPAAGRRLAPVVIAAAPLIGWLLG